MIIAPEDYALWLGEDGAEPAELKALLKPYPAELMTTWAVDPRMDKAKVNEPGSARRVA